MKPESKRLFGITLAAMLAIVDTALACSPHFSHSIFEQDAFEANPLRIPTDSNQLSKSVPAPIVLSMETRRSIAADGFSCDDLGTIALDLDVPEGHPTPIQDYAIALRLVEGSDPNHILTNLPLKQWDTTRKEPLLLHWLDGGVSWYDTIDMVVDIHLMTGRNNIGPPTRYHIVSEPRKQRTPERKDR